MDKSKHIVISLGGSLIVPEEIDVDFLSLFVKTIQEYVSNGFKFVIITGGGKIARKYNNATRAIMTPSNEDLDMIGIASTRINAELLRIAFGYLSYGSIIMDPDNIPTTDKPVLVGGGWKPGNSSDLAAVHCAASLNIKKLINLSNIDFVCDKDPRKFPDAKIIKESSWADFRALLPTDWDPGLNAPFDPIAAKQAELLSLEVVIMNGKNIESFRNYLNGEAFTGTTVK